MENNKILSVTFEILYKIPFGIISILCALMEWLGFAFAFMIIPALIAWFFWFWAVVFGIVGILMKKRITSIIGLILSFIPTLVIVVYILIRAIN